MERFVINGGRKLSGSVEIESAKNSVLPMLAASILTEEKVVIEKCPDIGDLSSMLEILAKLGVKTEFVDGNLTIDAKNIVGCEVPGVLATKLRSSIFLMGALLSRCKKAQISLPGGCDIGERPIDLHLNSLKTLGATVEVYGNEVFCSADLLKGASIRLNFPSVGATENLMLAAVMAKGKTEIRNAAKEPEIVDLMCFLNSMGAKIYGAGTSTILIDGVKKLRGTVYKPIPDRIETGTFLLAGLITGGEVEIKGVNVKNISALLHKFCDNTCKITIKNDIIYIKSNGTLRAFDFSTGPYPHFPTDLQAQTTALLSVADGTSVICENVFERRFSYVDELNLMGADIKIKGRNAIVKGVKHLYGANVFAKDLRGGAALLIASLVARGDSTVYGVQHIKRGYYNIDKKLCALGADVKLLT